MAQSESDEIETKCLEQVLDEGLDDVDAGRVVLQEDSRREVEVLLSALAEFR